jgi:hypothetical protein
VTPPSRRLRSAALSPESAEAFQILPSAAEIPARIAAKHAKAAEIGGIVVGLPAPGEHDITTGRGTANQETLPQQLAARKSSCSSLH